MTMITELPLDLKATLSSNAISGEIRTLTRVPNRNNRLTTTRFGAFYADTLQVRDEAGNVLTRDKDYVVTYYYEDLMHLTAKEVAAMIVVTNPVISTNIRLTYHAVGGPYSLALDEVQAIMDQLNTPPEKIKWEDIINKPNNFNPSSHVHEYWQLYGLDYTDINLTELANAFKYGFGPVVAVNQEASDGMRGAAEKASNDYMQAVLNHTTNYNNPHNTTTTQLGIEKLSNFSLATTPESYSATIDYRYQPIGGIYNQLQQHAKPALVAHIPRVDNPHQLTRFSPGIDAYNYSEVVALYAGKLRYGEIAVGTAALNGMSEPAMTNYIRSNLGSSNVDSSTKFTQAQITPVVGWPPRNYPTDYIVMGRGYTYLGWVFGQYRKPPPPAAPAMAPMTMRMSTMSSFVSPEPTNISGTTLSTITTDTGTSYGVFQNVDGEIVQIY